MIASPAFEVIAPYRGGVGGGGGFIRRKPGATDFESALNAA